MEMNLIILLGIILIALIVQYLVEAIKGLLMAIYKYVSEGDFVVDLVAPFIAMAFSITLCILAGLDIFVAFGFPLTYPIIGMISTGIIASLGAGKVYALFMDFKEYRDKIAVEQANAKEKDSI